MKFLSKYNIHIKRNHFFALAAFVIIALCHKIIANDKYLVVKSENGIKFLSDDVKTGFSLKAIIPYSSRYIDRNNRKVGPFDKQNVKSLYYRHWFGTDSLGRDVLAGLIYGSYVALQVGLFTMLISMLLGIFMGYLSGYYGDSRAYIKKFDLVLWVMILFVFTFYGYYNSGLLRLLFLGIPWLFLIYFLKRIPGLQKGMISFPWDSIIMRIIEVLSSIPALFLILILLSLLGEPSIWNVIIIIGLLKWPVVARHLRSEIISIKEEQFIDAAKVIGQSDFKILIYHILPMAMSPLIIVAAFGFSAAILLESTLSFLGIGVPLDLVTWGSLIKDSRNNFDAWWLALFPGLMIYALIYLFNSIGDYINDSVRKA